MLELLIFWFVRAVHVAADDDLPNIKLNRADCWCDENCLVFFPRLICSGMRRAKSRRVRDESGNVWSVARLSQEGFIGLHDACSDLNRTFGARLLAAGRLFCL